VTATAATRPLEADVLVIGGGLAGCTAAIHARAQGASVILVDKGYVGKSGQTPFAGSYCVFNAEWGDDLASWMDQINTYGDHLNHRIWTELCFRESYARFEELSAWGVQFERDESGSLRRGGVPLGPCRALGMEVREPSMILRRKVIESGCSIVDRVMVAELLTSDGVVMGALGIPMDAEGLFAFKAKATVLAAGAGGFRPTNWPINNLTSDADCMAYRVGAEITGKEFADPHAGFGDRAGHMGFGRFGREPDGGKPRMGRRVNAAGEPVGSAGTLFLDLDFEAHAGKAPIYVELEGGERHPLVGGASSGMSTHKTEGTWPADTDCSSNVRGLFAAGDSLGTMQSGATYAAIGQSVLGCSVTGARAGIGAATCASEIGRSSWKTIDVDRRAKDLVAPLERQGGFSPRWVTQMLQNTMIPYYVMYVKHEARLQAALTNVEFFRDHLAPALYARDQHELRLAHETRNMILNAEMRLRASLYRTESRGCHYREDHPRRDDPDWLAWVIIRKGEDGRMELFKRPVPAEWWPDFDLPYEKRYPLKMPGG
jgi:succinate dehydrogenase/fumarate reductase flavoprotein subunit